uniref:Uncharacterized protein n=1 Tax=Glossina austeni TaxID=7395 RepID=A0A1A9UEX1_GLOAU
MKSALDNSYHLLRRLLLLVTKQFVILVSLPSGGTVRTTFACKVFFINILRRRGSVFYAHKYANVKRAFPKFVCNIHKNASQQRKIVLTLILAALTVSKLMADRCAEESHFISQYEILSLPKEQYEVSCWQL